MKSIVTGGAGFIGSHLVDRLLKEDNEVTVIDNLSSGKRDFLKHNMKNNNFDFIEADLLGDVERHFKGSEEVWHLSANPDVRILDPEIHLKQNLLATKKVLDAMVKHGIKNISFTSSSTVYGEAISKGSMAVPTSEEHKSEPISLYGAAKLASEALIGAYCHSYGMKCWNFRFANVIGPRSTHGIIFDLMKKIEKNSKELEILGNGKQKKSYVYIDDCIDAMLTARKKSCKTINTYNIGSEDWIEIKEIAEMVCKAMKVNPKFRFTGGDRGWKGDVPLMILDIKKIRNLGWIPKINSKEAVKKTINEMLGNNKF